MFSHYNFVAGSAINFSPRKVPWVARVANSPINIEAGSTALWARRVYPRAQTIIANSAGLAEGFLQHHRRPVWPVIHVPNPLDLELVDRGAADTPRFSLPASPVVVAAGRLAPQKRYDVMLKAFARIASQTGATLIILGDGPERAAVQRLISALNLGHRVTLAGFQNNPHPIIARASLFLLTSDYEGSPNALLEAQALGVPAVSTKCPFGPDEIIEDGVTGYLAACGDADAIATRALKVLKDQGLQRAMGISSRERVRSRFGLAATLPVWERALHQAATGRQPGPIN
jgi:glycosyltransferase involved in cell wall biosynthesis